MSFDASPHAERRAILVGRALPDEARVKATLAASSPRAGCCAAARRSAKPRARPSALRRRCSRCARRRQDARAALWLGPDEWLLIAEDEAEGLGEALEAALAGVAHALIDVSHRQCAIELAGPGAARLINAGCPLDLDLSAFPVGMVARTLLLKAEIMLWRREAERFRLEVARSFAPYVAAVLTASARDQAGD